MPKKMKKLSNSQKEAVVMMAVHAVKGREHVRCGGTTNAHGAVTRRTAEVLGGRGLICRVEPSTWRPQVRLTAAGLVEAERIITAGEVTPFTAAEANDDLLGSLRSGDIYVRRVRVEWAYDTMSREGKYRTYPVRGGTAYDLVIGADATEAELREAAQRTWSGSGWDRIEVAELVMKQDVDDEARKVEELNEQVTALADEVDALLDKFTIETPQATVQAALNWATDKLNQARALLEASDVYKHDYARSERNVNDTARRVLRIQARIDDPVTASVRAAALELGIDARIKVGRNDPSETTVTLSAADFQKLVEHAQS